MQAQCECAFLAGKLPCRARALGGLDSKAVQVAAAVLGSMLATPSPDGGIWAPRRHSYRCENCSGAVLVLSMQVQL